MPYVLSQATLQHLRRIMRVNTLLIDGNNMAYRAKYSFQLSYRGKDTSVIYGCMRILSTLAKEYQPWSIVVMWDGGLPLFRKEAVTSYKSTRERDVDYYTFKEQMDELHAVLPKLGILSIKRGGIEADDLLYHGAKMLPSAAIVTTDADLLQAVDANTAVIRPGKKDDTVVTLDNFTEVVGIPPNKFLMYKCLIGDSSDNIKGVGGIGHITAVKLLAKITGELTPDAIIAACTTVKMRGKLIEFFDTRYAKVRNAIDLSEDKVGARHTILEQGDFTKFDKKFYFMFCSKWGFSSLIEYGASPVEFAKLIAPEWNAEGRTPRIWDFYREAADGQQEQE
jgi:5'-3' exonuclease